MQFWELVSREKQNFFVTFTHKVCKLHPLSANVIPPAPHRNLHSFWSCDDAGGGGEAYTQWLAALRLTPIVDPAYLTDIAS